MHMRSHFKKGKREVMLRWNNSVLPKKMHDRFSEEISAAGYSVTIGCNDEGDGYEILIGVPT